MKDDKVSPARHASEKVCLEDLNPQRSKHASEIATALARYHKSRQLYNENNPVPRASLERLSSSLKSFLDANDALTFAITETEFVFHAKAVYSNPDRRESLPFRLYRDGVRSITFHSGITPEEIFGLLETLGQVNVHSEEGDSDVVTQLWEHDFVHITYLAVDECIDCDAPTAGPSGSEHCAYGPPFTLEEQVDGVVGMATIMDLPLTEEGMESIADVTLTNDELEEIGQQILAEEKDNPRMSVLEIFMEILQCSTSKEAKVDVARGIQVLFVDFLDGGNLAEATRLLVDIKGLLERNKLLDGKTCMPESLENTFTSFLETLGQEKQLIRIEPSMEGAAARQLEEYERYLSQLLPNAVGPLCSMLGRTKNERAKEMLCRVLGMSAKENLGALVDFLSDPRWYLVRNIVRVLRIMRDKRTLPYLERLVLHQDVRVRTEVVHCIAELGGEESEILMRRCLRDPEKGVRMVAAKKMGQVTGGRAAAFLIECILEKSFTKKSFDEKWEFFEALGHAGGNETIPVLEKLLRKRSIFHPTETQEINRCSATTLARLGTPRAIQILEKHARKTRGEVRKACADALRLCSRREND